MNKRFKRVTPIIIAAMLTLGGLPASTAAQSTAAQKGGSQAGTQAMARQIDINSASKEELSSLPGIGDVYSQKIIDARPYRTKTDLETRNIIPKATYNKISSMITAKQPTTTNK
jgi:competence protein ComEA